jgi:hypothetical protein
MPRYSLFDVKKGDAARVVAALKGADFLGKRLYSEVADPEKDYAQASRRKSKSHDDDEPTERRDRNRDRDRSRGRHKK